MSCFVNRGIFSTFSLPSPEQTRGIGNKCKVFCTFVSLLFHTDIDTLCSEKPNGRNVAKMLNFVQPRVLTDTELLHFTLFGVEIK